MNVVGIDPSLTSTGVASRCSLELIKSKTTGLTVLERYERMARIVAAVSEKIPADTDLVIIEGPSLGQQRQNGTAARNGLWWLMIGALLDRRLAVVEVPPATLKKFATGSGAANKYEMRMALERHAGLSILGSDLIDAWWLRQIGLHLVGDPAAIPLTERHLETLHKLRLPTHQSGTPHGVPVGQARERGPAANGTPLRTTLRRANERTTLMVTATPTPHTLCHAPADRTGRVQCTDEHDLSPWAAKWVQRFAERRATGRWWSCGHATASEQTVAWCRVPDRLLLWCSPCSPKMITLHLMLAQEQPACDRCRENTASSTASVTVGSLVVAFTLCADCLGRELGR